MNENEKKLLMKYLKKYFNNDKIKLLIEKFTLKQLRRLLGELDIEYFALAYFPKYFDREFGEFHKELFDEVKYILSSKGINEAFGLPREHGKSTILSFLLPLHATLYGKSQFTLIISATEQIALPFLDMIKAELTENEAIVEDFGNLKGDRFNNNEIWLKGNNIDACIMIRGIDGSLRGVHYKHHRPQLVLLDDLLKEDAINSETKRQQVKETFKNVVIPIGTKDTNILVVGTILHEDDLMSDLLNGKIAGFKSIKKSAVIEFSTKDNLWNEWEKLYTNLEDIDRDKTALSFFNANKQEMLEGTKILWTEYLDYYYLMQRKVQMGDSSFYREMQNNPRNNEEYPFQTLQYWDKLPDFNELQLVMMVDPALAKTKRSDFSAVVTLGRHIKTGQMYVVDGDIRRIPPHELIVLVSDKLKVYPVDCLGIESNQFQHLLYEDMKKHLLLNKQYVNITAIPSKGNKEARIMSLETSITHGYIKFNPDNKTFNKQIMDYCGKKSKNDDAPDVLALGYNLLQEGSRALTTLPSNLLF